MTSPAVTVSPLTTDECSSSPVLGLGRTNSSSTAVGGSFINTMNVASSTSLVGGSVPTPSGFPSVSPFTPISPASGGYNQLLGLHGRSSFLSSPAAPTSTPVIMSPNTPAGPRMREPLEETEKILPQSPVSTVAAEESSEMDQDAEASASNRTISSPEEEVSTAKHQRKRQHSRRSKKGNKERKTSSTTTAPVVDAPHEELNNTFNTSDGDDEQEDKAGQNNDEQEEEASSRRKINKDEIKIHHRTCTVAKGSHFQKGLARKTISPPEPGVPAHHQFNHHPSSTAVACSSNNSSFASIAAKTHTASSSPSAPSSSLSNSSSTIKVELDARRGIEVGHPSHLHQVQARCGRYFEGDISLGQVDSRFVACPLDQKFDCKIFLNTDINSFDDDEQEAQTRQWAETTTSSITSKTRNDPYSFNVIPQPSLMLKVQAAQKDAILLSNSWMMREVSKCLGPASTASGGGYNSNNDNSSHSILPESSGNYHQRFSIEEEVTNFDGDGYTFGRPMSSYSGEGSPVYQEPPTMTDDVGGYVTTSPSPLNGLPEDHRILSSHHQQPYFHGLEAHQMSTSGQQGLHLLAKYRQRRHSRPQQQAALPPRQLSPVSLSEVNSNAGFLLPSPPHAHHHQATPPQTIARHPSAAFLAGEDRKQLSKSSSSSYSNGSARSNAGLSQNSSMSSPVVSSYSTPPPAPQQFHRLQQHSSY